MTTYPKNSVKIPERSLYLYSDYRKFLADYFEEQKKSSAKFSHRYFALKAGFKTPNFLHLVIAGKRNLTKESLTKIAMALGLGRTESEYFENLIFFNQCTGIKEKNYFYDKMTGFRKSELVGRINQEQFEYYASWIHPVVREVACFNSGFMDEFQIAEAIRPKIHHTEVRQSLQLLERLGFLKKQKGQYSQTLPLLSTGSEVASLAVLNYHIKTMALAAEALERFRADKRDISNLVLGINQETFLKIKKKAEEFRKEILAMAQIENPDRTYMINLHFFPVTRLPK